MLNPFDFSVDSENRILNISVWGFWLQEQAVRFQETMTSEVSCFDHDNWSILIDVTRFPIQISSVQSIFRKLMICAVERGLARVATVVGGSLTKVQIERLACSVCMEKSRYEWFRTDAAARDWLVKNGNEYSETETREFLQTI